SGRRGRRRAPRPGPRREARRLRRRLPLAFHRPPPESQGTGCERALRAMSLTRVGVRGAETHDPGARRGEPLRRADQIGRHARKAAGAPRDLSRRSRADDDAARDGRPGGVATLLSASPRARREPRTAGSVDGDEPGLPGRGGGGSDLRPRRRSPVAALTSAAPWGFPTSGPVPSSTSASPRKRTGTRTATSPRTSSRRGTTVRMSAGYRRGDRGTITTTTGRAPSPRRS